MGLRIHSMIFQAKQVLKESSLAKNQVCKATTASVPKGFLPVYVGDVQKRRFLVPVSYLYHPKFQKLLERSAEEFFWPSYGWSHNSMQGRSFHQTHLPTESIRNPADKQLA